MAKEVVANGAAKAPRGKKGEGPVAITYLDHAGNESKRVSEKTTGIRVADKGGNVKDFNIDNLPPVIRHQLVAVALKKHIDTYVRNTVDEDGSNVIELATHTYDTIKSGAIYTRKEGVAGQGRPFDTEFWVSIVAATAVARKTPASEKQLAQLTLKLQAMAPSERKDWIARAKTDKVFSFCWKQAELAKAKDSLKKGVDNPVNALDGLF